jgi:hypothetical protein
MRKRSSEIRNGIQSSPELLGVTRWFRCSLSVADSLLVLGAGTPELPRIVARLRKLNLIRYS